MVGRPVAGADDPSARLRPAGGPIAARPGPHSTISARRHPLTSTPRSGHRPGPARRLAAGLAALAMAVLVAAPAAAGDPATIVAGGTGGNGGFVPSASSGSAAAGSGDAPPAGGGVPGPSVAYEETIAHAGRDYDFAPGAPVSVPLRSRGASAAAAPVAGASAGSPVAAGSSETSGDPTTSPPPRAAAGSVVAAGVGVLRREVYGFLPYWELVDPDRRLDYASLSTIAYFSAAAAADGSLVTKDPDGTATSGWGGWTSQAMTDVIDTAHAAGVRVDFTVTLFAWTSTQRKTQAALLGSATARSRLVSTLVSTVVGRGADGVNLDVEPLVAGYEDEIVALVRELRVALDAAGPGRRITVDVLGSPENYPHEDLVAPGAADSIFIMGYDYRGSGAAYAGSISPLTGAGYDLTETVARYTARVPASKVILGIPYYGRAWSTVSDALRAKTQSSATYGYSATASYSLAASLAEENGRRWDDDEQVPWTAYRRTVCDTCTETWRQLYYDDVESLRRKYALADTNGLAGVGIWALGYDGTRPELAALLREVFGATPTDTTPPRTALAVLPPDAPDEGIVVSWTATDAGGIAAYDVQVSAGGGPWSDWLVATTATSDVWLGRTGTGYAFRARATDAAGNVSRWTTEDARSGATTLAKGGFVRVVASSLPLRASASTGAKKVATVRTGDILLVTAGPKASGGVTWVQVSGPLTQWPIVSPVRTKAWMAVKQGKTVLAAATRRPSATVVAAGFSGLTFDGAGGASLGAAGAAHRAFSPGNDGSRDRLALAWRARVAMTSVSARILRTDGSLVGSIPIGSVAAGSRTWAWDGKVAGAVVPDGAYLVQLLGRGSATTYRSPSARPATPAQIDRFAVTVDTVPPILGSATISGTTLAPDAPGGAASVAVAGSAPDAASWTVVVARVSATDGAVAAGTAARTVSGSGPSASAAWDGTDDAGRRLPRGTYRVTLSMADAAGNAATSSWTVDLQTAGPQLSASVDPDDHRTGRRRRRGPRDDPVDDRRPRDGRDPGPPRDCDRSLVARGVRDLRHGPLGRHGREGEDGRRGPVHRPRGRRLRSGRARDARDAARGGSNGPGVHRDAAAVRARGRRRARRDDPHHVHPRPPGDDPTRDPGSGGDGGPRRLGREGAARRAGRVDVGRSGGGGVRGRRRVHDRAPRDLGRGHDRPATDHPPRRVRDPPVRDDRSRQARRSS